MILSLSLFFFSKKIDLFLLAEVGSYASGATSSICSSPASVLTPKALAKVLQISTNEGRSFGFVAQARWISAAKSGDVFSYFRQMNKVKSFFLSFSFSFWNFLLVKLVSNFPQRFVFWFAFQAFLRIHRKECLSNLSKFPNKQ